MWEKKNACEALEVSWRWCHKGFQPGSPPPVWSRCLGPFYKRSKAESKTQMKETEGKYFFSHFQTSIYKRKKRVLYASFHKGRAQEVDLCPAGWTGNVPSKLKDASWTPLSHADGRRFSRFAPRGPNASKHFPSSGEGLRRAWAEEFQRSAPRPHLPHLLFSFYLQPFSVGFISQRSTPGSIIRRLQPWPLYFFNNGFWSRSEFSLPSTCRCVVPDNNPHLAWEIWEWMFVLDLALVGWNRPRAPSSCSCVL